MRQCKEYVGYNFHFNKIILPFIFEYIILWDVSEDGAIYMFHENYLRYTGIQKIIIYKQSLQFVESAIQVN